MATKTAAKKIAKPAKNGFKPFKVTKEEGMGGASRYFISHNSVGEGKRHIRLGSFLRILGSCGWGFPQAKIALEEAGLPVVPPVTREELAKGNYAEGTTPNTVRSQLHSGIACAKGRAGTVNADDRNRVHHGVVNENDRADFEKVVKAALAYYVGKIGSRGVQTEIKPDPKPAKKAKKAK